MNTLARPAMYGAYHHIYVDGREDEPRTAVGLCGQICENTDFWVRDRELPEGIDLGDVIVVENAGAYGYVMSYQYNGRLRPGEVLTCPRGERAAKVRADGTLVAEGATGSIHQVGAALEGAPSCNGWTYWHFRREGVPVPIDVLRQQIRAEMAAEDAPRPN